MEGALEGFLERVYERYNHRSCIGSDPLGFVLRFPESDDREVVGLLAAALAFGRVEQIARSVSEVLALLGPPAARVDSTSREELGQLLRGFRHRFVSGEEVADLLEGVRVVRRRWGSLNAFFVDRCYAPFLRSGGDVVGALSSFVQALGAPRDRFNYLLPEPSRGSACKRLHLFLRWMVRRDEVDPGPWEGVRAADLVVPLDTHMHRICGMLGLARRKQADGRTAREVTEAFRRIAPLDPVRFDFSLTRVGMAGRLDEIPAELQTR